MDEPVIKAATETSGSPAEFLKNVVGKQVKVRIGSGIDYEGQSSIFAFGSTTSHRGLLLHLGTLSCLDGYMNVAMENTREVVNGEMKNSYGDAFIRGNNGKCTCPISSGVVANSQTGAGSVLYISAMEDI
jgi:U6 snRNA-associated Sm-like protein LSm6